MSNNLPFQDLPKIWNMVRGLDHPVKLVWIGLDNAGKTSLIKRLKTGEFFFNTPRTMGLSVDKLFYESDNNFEIISWDLGGQIYFRENLWKDYLKGSSGIIYVIDVSDPDTDRFDEAKKELWNYVLNSKDVVKNIPVLVLGNKSDLQNKLDNELLNKKLELDTLDEGSFGVFNVSALSGLNLDKAFIWLFKSLSDKNIKSKKEKK